MDAMNIISILNILSFIINMFIWWLFGETKLYISCPPQGVAFFEFIFSFSLTKGLWHYNGYLVFQRQIAFGKTYLLRKKLFLLLLMNYNISVEHLSRTLTFYAYTLIHSTYGLGKQQNAKRFEIFHIFIKRNVSSFFVWKVATKK